MTQIVQVYNHPRSKKASAKKSSASKNKALSKWTGRPMNKFRHWNAGKFGPASEVVHIDPSEYPLEK